MQPLEQAGGLRVIDSVAATDANLGIPPHSPPAVRQPPRRPSIPTLRFLKAYWVTIVVIASYLLLKLEAKYRSPAAMERIIVDKHRLNAKRVEKAIVSLQGLFIKVGQLFSIMTNFLPQEFRHGLESLQDQVPPRPYEDIVTRIRDEFAGRGPDELFAEFARQPVAAASIGQVHFARLHSGEPVAVKVQYSDIEDIARQDLRTMRRIMGIIQFFFPYRGLEGMLREITSMVMAELDFRTEAENVRTIAANFTNRRDVTFAIPIDELTTSRVLTTRWEEGVKIGDTEELARIGIDRSLLARLVIESYCQQIFVDGVYHADPHPGNLLVRRQDDGAPSIVFLDFGAIARIS
ncbi:MAG: AarF/ABC1/UbiB kinase family protein, partial [Pseudomonadota bacterium]